MLDFLLFISNPLPSRLRGFPASNKVPIFSIEILDATSVYPRLGGHRIRVLALRSTTLKRPSLLLGFGFLFHFIRAFLRFLRGFMHDFLALLLCGTSGFLDSLLR
jgi:hypothetical protein